MLQIIVETGNQEKITPGVLHGDRWSLHQKEAGETCDGGVLFKNLQSIIKGFVHFHPQYVFVTFDFNSTANRCWHRGRRNSGRSNAGY